MKKSNITILILLILMVASGCKKRGYEPIQDSSKKIHKEFYVNYGTSTKPGKRVSIDSKTMDVLWSEDDYLFVAVNKTDNELDPYNSNLFDLTQGAGTTRGTFSGEIVEGDGYKCLYPFNSGISTYSQAIYVTNPDGTFSLSGFSSVIDNSYKSEKIGFNVSNNLIGIGTTSDGEHFKMKHLTGVLRLRVKADREDIITNIILSDKDNLPLAGVFTVDVNDDDPVIVLSDDGTSYKSIEMDLEDGVIVGPDDYAIFDFSIPGGIDIFDNGFIAKMVPLEGDTVLITSDCATIEKGSITLIERTVQIKDKPEPKKETVTDVCGNEYDVITIGKQKWMAQNFRCNQYATKSSVKNYTSMSSSLYPAYYYQYSSNDNVALYGYIYNYAAALNYSYTTSNESKNDIYNPDDASNIQGICPDGFRVPSTKDWKDLEEAFNSDKKPAVHLKDNVAGWQTLDGDNSSEFSARAGGALKETIYSKTAPAQPKDIKTKAYFMTASGVKQNNTVNVVTMSDSDATITTTTISKANALSVRCIKK